DRQAALHRHLNGCNRGPDLGQVVGGPEVDVLERMIEQYVQLPGDFFAISLFLNPDRFIAGHGTLCPPDFGMRVLDRGAGIGEGVEQGVTVYKDHGSGFRAWLRHGPAPAWCGALGFPGGGEVTRSGRSDALWPPTPVVIRDAGIVDLHRGRPRYGF